jgi:broad specificity phosphatase PhoE
MPFVDENNQPVQLSPEDQAAYWQQNPPAGALVDESGKPINALRDLSAPDLAALSTDQKDKFDLLSAFNADPEAQKNPDTVQKVADAFHILREQPLLTGVTPTGVIKNVWNTFAGLGRYGAKTAIGTGQMAESLAARALPGDTAETFANQTETAGRQNLGETAAATEQGMTGLVTAATKVAAALGRGLHLTKSLSDYSPEDKRNALFDAAAVAQQAQQTATGQGPIAQAVTGGAVPVRPEEVSKLTSPFDWEALGGLTRGAAAVTPEVLGSAKAAAGELLAKGAGKISDVASRIGAGTARVAEKAAPVAAAVGVPTYAIATGDAHLLAESLLFGSSAGEKAAAVAEKTAKGLDAASKFAKQVSGEVPVTSAYAQAARDTLLAAPAAAVELGKGAAFDVAMASGADTPQERQAAIGLGTAFGLLGAANMAGRHVISGQLIAPRGYDISMPVSGSGRFPALEALHKDAFSQLAPGQQQRLNAVRSFLKKASPNTDVFALGEDPAVVSDALQKTGLSPEQADFYSQQAGFSTKIGDRKIIGVAEPGAAPHEAFHGIEDVIGAAKMRELDAVTKQQYADRWNDFGRYYAQRLTGQDPGADWKTPILTASKWGSADAGEKLYRETANQYVLEAKRNGQPMPTEQEIRDAVNLSAPRLPDGTVDWQKVLTPAEQQETADRYIAREKLAENFDAFFKHAGPTLESGKQVPEKIAQIMGQMMQFFGVNPLAGRASEALHVPLNPDVIKAVSEAGRGAIPEAPEIASKTLSAPSQSRAPMPVTPQQQQEAADEARQAAAAAPTTPVAGGTQSPREILGAIAESIASRTGIKLNYLSAPDEPAAAISMNRKVRRALIEAGRTMSAAGKSLWEKSFFPERVIQNKNGSFQVSGWAPEVFAANVHRTAQEVSQLGHPQLVPYPLDPKTGSLTPDGWRQLYEDTQKAVRNYVGGYTASGEDLVVPRSAVAAGASKPPVRGAAEALDQNKADFINAMFGIKLPKTPRISTKELGLPTAIVGEDISRATLPGRVQPPIVPRGTFEGPKAEALGIAGRPIMEVNPWRNQAEAAGFDSSKLIEARQNLNVDNIKDVAMTPEQPQFRGNTLTLQAGFMPAEISPEKEASIQERIARGIPPANIRLSIFNDPSLPEKYHGVQVDEVDPSAPPGQRNIFSSNPEDMRRLGYDMPTTQELLKLPFGQHTLADAKKVLGGKEPTGQFSPADTAGVTNQSDVREARKAWREQGVQSPYFKRWFGDSKVVDESGGPLVIYHGTTHNFDRFANVRGNPENSLGIGHYFTTDENDASGNYGTTTSSDLNSRLEWRVDQLIGEDMPEAAARKQARRELVGRTEKVIPAYLKLENPVVLDPKGGTHFNYDYDESTGQESGTSVDLYNELMRLGAEHKFDAQSVWNDITENGADDLKAYDIWKEIKDSDAMLDATDENGNQLSSEIARQLFENLGYDGIELANPADEYQGMRLDPDTKHYVAFNSEQVKGVENRGTFSQQDPRFQFLPSDENREEESVPKTFIVRHGSTEMNNADPAKDLIRGHLDVPLDDKGKKEAKETAAKIAEQGGVSHIVASDLGRTLQTAAEISKATGATIEPDPGLRPWKLGPTIEGHPTSKMLPKIAELTDNPDTRPPGGETFNEFKDRFLSAWNRIQAEHPDKNTAVVTHYRGTKLLDAWRAAGVDNNEIDKGVFETYDKNKKPGHVDVVDKTGNAFSGAPAKETPAAQFATRKAKQDYEFKESPGSLFSKAWVLPNGKIVQLGGKWHHEWVNENPEVMKQFGLKKTTSGEENRVDALKRGFARVNYERNTGTLKVEARAQDWARLSPSIKEMVRANLGRVDNMDVHLLDDKAQNIVEQDGVALHTYDPEERMDHIPLITEPSATTTFSPQSSAESNRGAQFMPETRWYGQEREGEKEHRWDALSNSILHPDMRTPANEGEAPEVTLEALKKEGYKTVDWAETPTFHDHTTRAVFYKNDRGRFPLSEEGVRKASEAARQQEKKVQAIAYPQDSDVQFMPGGDARAIKAAAIRDPETGKVYEGPMHFMARQNYIKEHPGFDPMNFFKFEEGFTDNGDRFLSRTQAFERAKELKQLKPVVGANQKNAEQTYDKLGQLASERTQLAQFFPMQKGEGPDEVLRTARKFWVTNGGETRPAWGTHAHQAAQEILGDWKPKDPENAGPETNEEAIRRGHVRGVYRMYPHMLDLNGRPWSELSVPAQKEIRRLSQSLALPTDYNGRPVDTGVGPFPLDSENVQFMPGGDPRAIRAAAIRDPDTGEVTEGMAHFYARMKHSEEHPGMGPFNYFKFQEGFVDNSGNFLDRVQAFERAKELNQLKPAATPGQKDLHEQFDRMGKLAAERVATSQFMPSRREADNIKDEIEPLFQKHGMSLDVVGSLSKKPEGNDIDFHLRPEKSGATIEEQMGSFYDHIAPELKKQGWDLRDTNNPRDYVHPVRGKEWFVSADDPKGNTVEFFMSGPEGFDSAQFRPGAAPEEFKDEKTLPAALTKPNWAVLTATQESLGAGTDKVNQEANRRLEKELKAAGFNPIPVKGNYKGVDQGMNYLVTGMTPDEAVAWGRKFGQESVLTPRGLLYGDGSLSPAIPEETTIGDRAKKQDFYSQIEGGPAFSMGIDFGKRVPAAIDTGALPGFEGEIGSPKTRALSTVEKGNMTMKQLGEQFPEAVVPRKKDEAIPSKITESPLYKQAGSEENAVKAFAKRLVDFAKQYKDHPAFEDGKTWYDHIAPKIKKHFGKTGQLFAEMLAATSPGQKPDTNFADALAAHDMAVAGKYDKQVKKLVQGLDMIEKDTWRGWLTKHGTDLPETPTPETFLGQWIDFHDLKPRKENGALYGYNSVQVLKVAARKWLSEAGPKTSNFIQNLLGTGHEATIDLWADRTMRWAGYEGAKDRWRILPENKSGVSDEDFAFAQKAFSAAAKELGMRPDQLQGALWFAEKQRWADNGWSPLDLGTYEPEFAKIEQRRAGARQTAAIKQQAKKAAPALTGEQIGFNLGPDMIQPK